VVATVLYAVRYALLLFGFAAAIGFVTDPLVRAMQAHLGGPRRISAALAYIGLLALFAAAAYGIGMNACATPYSCWSRRWCATWSSRRQ
jgi:predicted PurR-regulated permease PerM